MAKSSSGPHRLIMETAEAGKRKYCVMRTLVEGQTTYNVCVKLLWFWISIQSFSDEDEEFAFGESMELFDMITSKYKVK